VRAEQEPELVREEPERAEQEPELVREEPEQAEQEPVREEPERAELVREAEPELQRYSFYKRPTS